MVIKKEELKTARLAKICIVLGLLVIFAGCATPGDLESLKKEFSSKSEASQLAQKKETEAQLTKIQLAQKETEAQLTKIQLAQKKETEAQLTKIQLAQKETEAHLTKIQDELEAKTVKLRAEVLEKAQAQEDQLSSQIEQFRGELNQVRERVSILNQIEADIKAILNQTRNMQAASKHNLRMQATLLKEHLKVIETTLKGMETPHPKSPHIASRE